MSSGGDAEIQAKLTLDDAASHVVEKLKGGFEHLDEKVHETQSELVGMAKQAVATAAGFQLDRGIESVKEFGHEIIAAATGAQNQQKALAGVLAMTDQTGASFDKLSGNAVELHDELEQIGIKAGVATDRVIDSFEDLAARSSKSVEEVKELTQQMALAGKAVPSGLEGLASGFQMMEMGMIRARNPVVQLITATHLLGGNAKEVAKQLQKMEPEKAIALGEKAITQMAEKMKNAPPSFQGVVQSLKDIRENMFEAMGVPILKTLVPPLAQMKKYFIDNKEAIEKWAQSAGEKVGEYVTEAAEKFKEGFEYIKAHADEIAQAIKDGAHAAKEVFEFIIAHKEAIALAFGAKAIGPSAIGMIAPVAKGATSLITSAGAAGSAGLGIAGGSAAAFAASTAVFAAAALAWAGAASEATKLYHQTGGLKSDAQQGQEARERRLQEISTSRDRGPAQLKEFENLRRAYVEQADAMGNNSRVAGEFADSMWRMHADLTSALTGIDDAAAQNNVQPIVDAYNHAMAMHDVATAQYAANVLAGSDNLQASFLSSINSVEGGFNSLADMVKGKSEFFEKTLRGLAGAEAGAGGKKPPAAAVHMSGGQTFNIKQDFRDQDPDRVATVFQKDIIRAAESRRQARVGTPFGM